LIIPPVAGYTFNEFADVFTIFKTMPATAVGNLTPAPDATVDTTLISFVSAVALACTIPAADIDVPTDLIW
jgi:hypothetical protein